MSDLTRLLSSRLLVGEIQQAAQSIDIDRDDCATLAMEIGLALLAARERPQNVYGFDIDAAIERRRERRKEAVPARRLVTMRSQPYLDYAVADYFHENPILRRAARHLERAAGLYLIGQLVTLDRRELEGLDGVSAHALDEFERSLGMVGLAFGMVTPRWRDPGYLPVRQPASRRAALPQRY